MMKEQEAGMPTVEVCPRHGLGSESTYNFKTKYGGLNVSDTHRLKSLEDENANLKRLLADTMLDNVALKDLLGKSCRLRTERGLNEHLERHETATGQFEIY